jgi:hypothetical protein
LLLYQLADSSTAPLFEVDGSVAGYPSRDAALIAYQLTKDGKRTLWLYDRATKKHRQLTTEGFESLSFRPFSQACRATDNRSRLQRPRAAIPTSGQST